MPDREVMGIADSFGMAFAKAQIGYALPLSAPFS
jgi:hypothetical protein